MKYMIALVLLSFSAFGAEKITCIVPDKNMAGEKGFVAVLTRDLERVDRASVKIGYSEGELACKVRQIDQEWITKDLEELQKEIEEYLEDVPGEEREAKKKEADAGVAEYEKELQKILNTTRYSCYEDQSYFYFHVGKDGKASQFRYYGGIEERFLHNEITCTLIENK